jgi:two-component system NtrC family sensor kinase
VLALCQEVLEQSGWAMKTASTVGQLATLLTRAAFDLVLLDTNLAPAEDTAYLQQIRAHHPDVPVLLLMDNSPDHAASTLTYTASAVKLGIEGILFKPLSTTELQQTITETFQKEQMLHAHQSMTALHRLSTMMQPLLTHSNLHHLYELAAEIVQAELHADWVALVLWDEQRETLRVEACLCPDVSCRMQIGQDIPLNNTLSGWVMRQQQPILVNQHEGFPSDVTLLLCCEHLVSALAVPLTVEKAAASHALGTIVAIRAYNSPVFTATDQELMLRLAQQTGIVLEQAQRHASLTASETRHRALVHHASDAILLLDADGQHILDANPAAEQMTGYPRSQLLSMKPQNLLVGLNQMLAQRNLTGRSWSFTSEDSCWLSEDKTSVEPSLRIENGRSIPISITISCIPYEDQQFLLIIARDMSNRWRLAQQLIQNEKLAVAGRLVSSIAHEINNPLQAIQNSLQLLINRSANGNGDKLQRYLLMAQDEVEHLSSIVQRVIDIYRPSPEGMRPTDLHDLLRAVITLVNQQLHTSNVRVVRELHPRLPLVAGISSHLKQVYISLILNAIESMPDGGVLTIRTYVIRDDNGREEPASADQGTAVLNSESTAQPGKRFRVVVEFSDTGRGISEEELTRVFEPFYTTRSNGVGLSLAISYGIVEQHNGKLTVNSALGQGTTFRLTIPALT